MYRFHILLLWACLCQLGLSAQAPGGYYDGTQNLNGYALKSALQQIITAHTVSWNYGDLPAFYEQTDRDYYYEQDSSVLDIYAENPSGPDPYNYYYSNNSLIGSASAEGQGWNREHIYSQSFFHSYYPMYADLHFILPADARVNQRRSNYPFAEVGNASFTSLNGTQVGSSATSGYTNTVTEPIDEFKGDVARMLLYVAVRYEQLLPFFQYDNVRNPMDSVSEKAFKQWYIPLLLSWNTQDPVSLRERDRNDQVYAIQGNRNPFVDHPEWADAIWGNLPSDTTVPPSPSQPGMTARGRYFINIQWAAAQTTGIWAYEIFLNDEYIGSTKGLTYTIDHLEPATVYDIKVRSYSAAYMQSPFSPVLTVATASTDTFATDLMISKLIVGSGENKAIEIRNRTGHTVDLRPYYLNMRQENSSSGALYWSSNKIQLEGMLAHNQNLVIMSPLAQLSCMSPDSADIRSRALPMTFDGTLAIDFLYRQTTIDRLGDATLRADYAVGHSLYRKANAESPTPIYDTAEWDVYPLDYCDGLGHTAPQPNSVTTIQRRAIQIYPNPVREGQQLYISGDQVQSVREISLYTIQGQRLKLYEHPFRAKAAPYVLELPQTLSAGIYIIKIDHVVYRMQIF